MKPLSPYETSEDQVSELVSTPSGPLVPSYSVPSDVVSLSKPLSVSKTYTVICTVCVKVMVQLSPSP